MRRVFGDLPLRLALFDGTDLHTCAGKPLATVLVRNRRTLLELFLDPEVRFGESYRSGNVEVRGDLVGLLECAYRSLGRHRGGAGASRFPRGNSTRAARDNASWHYDLGNDFYGLWLDAQMVYSCAYFPTTECSLEDAQVAKMDLICRKLRLRPGERVVDCGGGWGALALHMARRYGVFVQAYNVSAEQIRHSRARAEEEGLAGRVEFLEEDYRRVRGRFDAFVSVGMLEHVGLENYGAMGEVIKECLDVRGGRGLLQFIGRDSPRPFSAWIRKRIFPGAYLPSLGQVIDRIFEPLGLSVLDVENLRPHYAKTLAHWRARFEAAEEAVRACYGEAFTRAWRLYLAGSEAAFRAGALQLFQVLFTRDGSRDIPWTRAAFGPGQPCPDPR